MPASFRSLCRAPEIGANSYELKLGGASIVLDAGMHPKQDGDEALPRYDLLPYDSVDAIFVTHAHLDHIGTLPVIQRNQPRSRAYMTPEVVDLADAMLHNSVNVMTSQRSELGIETYPLFTHSELDEICHNGPVAAYIGFDCTANSLHVGSLLQIMILRLMQRCGHKPIVLLGGGTTLIGDPSGKDSTRRILKEREIKKNIKNIKKVFDQVLNFLFSKQE